MHGVTFLLIVLIVKCAAYGQSLEERLIRGKEGSIIPEGIAYDSTTGNIYVSSIAKKKILYFTPKGVEKEFLHSRQYGYEEGLGMKVDNNNGLLWTLSNTKAGKEYTFQVQAFNLSDRKIKHSVSLRDTVPHLLNDLVIHKNGNIYITDTFSHTVFVLSSPYKRLRALIKLDTGDYPNGIASDQKENLFIATYQHGLQVYNLMKKELKNIEIHKDSIYAHGIDGLAYRNHTLIGVYNSGTPESQSLVVYSLNADASATTKAQVFPLTQSIYQAPTTFAVDGNRLYLVANSFLDLYNKNKESIKGIERDLLPVIIAVLKID